MTGFTPDQTDALRAPLAREHVKGRQQAGRNVSYIEGWLAIAEANRIFGFDGWDRETIDCRCVSEKPCEIGQQKKPGFRVAYVGKVRVTVRAGDRVIVREGTGYGSGIDQDIGEAHESAAKECETDALKRALMTFGNPFGLALYDKTQAEVEPVHRSAAPAVGARSASPPQRTAAAGTPSQASTSGQVLPPSPEEPPEVAQRRRIKSLIDKTDAAIKAARNSIALNTMWGSPETMIDLEEIAAAGEAGKEAAYKLRSRFMARADQLQDAEAGGRAA